MPTTQNEATRRSHTRRDSASDNHSRLISRLIQLLDAYSRSHHQRSFSFIVARWRSLGDEGRVEDGRIEARGPESEAAVCGGTAEASEWSGLVVWLEDEERRSSLVVSSVLDSQAEAVSGGEGDGALNVLDIGSLHNVGR